MSEEEIIKTVDNFLDGYRQYNVKTGETYIPYKYGEGQKFCYVEDFEAIQGLLDLYNKEKEYAMGLYYDVQGLQQDLDKEKEKNKELENCLQMAKQIMTADISEDFDCMKLKEFKEYLLNEIKLNENLEE